MRLSNGNEVEFEDKSGGSDRDRWLQQSRISSRRHAPTASSEVMRRMMRSLSENVPDWYRQQIFSRWSEIVGSEERAKLSRPVSLLEDGSLLVQTANYAIRTELLFARKEIILRINQIAGGVVVRRIQFTSPLKSP